MATKLRSTFDISIITVRTVEDARKNFLAGEPRNLFYLVAAELIDLASRNATKVSVAQALAVLLQTWNVSFYRFRGGFHEEDLSTIEALVSKHLATTQNYRQRKLTSFAADEEGAVRVLFDS